MNDVILITHKNPSFHNTGPCVGYILATAKHVVNKIFVATRDKCRIDIAQRENLYLKRKKAKKPAPQKTLWKTFMRFSPIQYRKTLFRWGKCAVNKLTKQMNLNMFDVEDDSLRRMHYDH